MTLFAIFDRNLMTSAKAELVMSIQMQKKREKEIKQVTEEHIERVSE